MSEDPVLFSRSEGVARLTLNRPEKINAFNGAMHARLAEILDEVEHDRSVRALLLTGAGRGFCSGQDLSEPIDPSDLGRSMEATYNPLIRRLRALPVPIVAAVQGVAAGAGASLALAADLVLAGRSAQFVQAFSRIGLMPDAGSTWILPRLIGPARALGLALLGDPLPAEAAAEWGMIWRVVDDERLEDEAASLARHLASLPTQALAAIKRAFAASSTNALDAQLALEADLQRELGRTRDFREGVRAFLEKRPARFEGH